MAHLALGGGAAIALALVLGLSRRDATAGRDAVLVAIALGVCVAVLGGRRRQHRSGADWARSALRAAAGWRTRPRLAVVGTAAWILLLVASVGWDGASFVAQRHDLPTLSRLVGIVTAQGWGRALLGVGWVAWGAWSALGFRRPPP